MDGDLRHDRIWLFLEGLECSGLFLRLTILRRELEGGSDRVPGTPIDSFTSREPSSILIISSLRTPRDEERCHELESR